MNSSVELFTRRGLPGSNIKFQTWQITFQVSEDTKNPGKYT